MATIRYFDNCFENEFIDVEYDSNKSLVEQIEAHQSADYTSEMVECYDPEEDRTFYVPLTDSKNLDAVIIVNGINVKSDYEVQSDDLINVMYFPQSDNVGSYVQGIGSGAVIGGILSAVLVSGLMALGVLTFSPGLLIGLVVAGMVTGGALGYRSLSKTNTLTDETGTSRPDVRGSANGSILNASYAFVIGKHLVNPRVINDPYTEYSSDGEDAYIRIVYEIGYGPVKITDIKLDEFLVTHNTSPNYLNGLLKGDDIQQYWENNEIELEILQQNPNSEINYGHIYPNVVKQKDITANVYFICDDSLTDIANASSVNYKGKSFASRFRTNGVWFTESCPSSFSITLNAQNGLYASYTETTESGNTTTNETKYASIPLWFAIQWRPYNKNNADSDSEGSDYSLWNNITVWNGIDCAGEYTKTNHDADIAAHLGNTITYEESMKEGQYYCSDIGYWGSTDTSKKTLCNFSKFSGKGDDYDYTGQVRLTATVTLTDEQKKAMLDDDNTINGIEVRVIRISPNYLNQTSTTSTTKSAESYSDAIMVDLLTTVPFDENKYRNDSVFEPVKFQSENLVNKMCYIAIKAKADDLGRINQQLKKLSCTVESFSPVWKDYKWLPEGVKRVTKYYGYYSDKEHTVKCDRTNNAYEVDLNETLGSEALAKSAYEEARGEGYSWYADEVGSNFTDLIKAEVFPSDNSCHTTYNGYAADTLPEDAEKYNEATAVSGFMLACVGPQNGRYALGYENIDLLSMAECYDAQQSVQDGSKDSDGNIISIKFEANGYVYEATKLEDLLSKLAIAGRSVYTYDNCGRIRMVMDKPVDYPRGVINQQNCISSSASYTYEQLPAGLRIEFPDENDGYNQNSLYCWSDGNSMKNYKGSVENYNFDFVTKNRQAWSLGRYVLANRVLNREALEAKIGMEGETWNLGDVVVFQDEDLLIGDGSGRVKEILKDDSKIYGFIMDSVYTYTGETEIVNEAEVCKKGVQIFTPKKYGNTRVQDFRLALTGYSVTINNITYKVIRGETNLVLFATPINISTSIEDISENDIVMFGDYTQISTLYRIVKVKPEKSGTFTYNLIQYTEKLYNYGTILPAFQNFITVPSPSSEGSTLSESPTTIKEIVQKDTALRNSINKKTLAGSKPYYAVTNTNVMPDLNSYNEATTEEEYVAGEFCSDFELIVGHYDETFRYLWSGVRFIYADGSMTTSISNVSLSVYGAQGAAGTDFRFDISPETVFLNPKGEAFKETEITTSCFLYKETVAQTIKSIECYYKVISDDNKLSCTTSEIKESEVYLGLQVTIPTNQLSKFISNYDTFPVIIVCHFVDEDNEEKTRMATVSVASNTSGTKYYFYLDYTNIKIDADGNIHPEYITATPLKMTSDGVYTMTEGEGGTSIKFRILPNGQYKTVGHTKLTSSDTFKEGTVYQGMFTPQYAYKVNEDGSYEYGSYLTTECPDGTVRAMVFFNRD